MTIENGMRPVHPGESLREDYLVPLGMSANLLSKAQHFPDAAHFNDKDMLPCSVQSTILIV
jgi:hypothetical protein